MPTCLQVELLFNHCICISEYTPTEAFLVVVIATCVHYHTKSSRLEASVAQSVTRQSRTPKVVTSSLTGIKGFI